jgi:hypothetical protein
MKEGETPVTPLDDASAALQACDLARINANVARLNVEAADVLEYQVSCEL